MIYLKTEEEIELIRESSLLVCETIAQIAGLIKPGIKGQILDKIAEEFIRDHQAEPAFKGFHGFPASLCISINEEVVHGIPNDRELREGDVVSIDCGVLRNGFYGDSAYTFALKPVAEDVQKLLRITMESLELGIAQAKIGNRIGDISYAIQHHTEDLNHYGVVRELVGHGIGKQLHEPPEVPNYGKRGRGPVLMEGMVIAIEPMINLGTRKVRQLKDGWTMVTQDQKVSAHFEHTVAVRKDGGECLSNHQSIEKSMKNNEELTIIA